MRGANIFGPTQLLHYFLQAIFRFSLHCTCSIRNTNIRLHTWTISFENWLERRFALAVAISAPFESMSDIIIHFHLRIRNGKEVILPPDNSDTINKLLQWISTFRLAATLYGCFQIDSVQFVFIPDTQFTYSISKWYIHYILWRRKKLRHPAGTCKWGRKVCSESWWWPSSSYVKVIKHERSKYFHCKRRHFSIWRHNFHLLYSIYSLAHIFIFIYEKSFAIIKNTFAYKRFVYNISILKERLLF